MSTTEIIFLVMIAVVAVVAMGLLLKVRRSQKVRSRFGSEDGRTIREAGNTNRAEAKLGKLEKRVQLFNLSPLSPSARAEFNAEWQRIQSGFVDDPKNAVLEADQLIQRMITVRGYPMADFEQRAADISVNHPLMVEHYRAGHEIALRHSHEQANTEDMRQAMLHYRTLFTDLVGEPEISRAATSSPL